MISDLTWKESVADIVLQIVQSTGSASFSIDEVYAFEHVLQARFPGNSHVREKTRQSLQKLLADRLLIRTQRGQYSVDITSPDLDLETDTVIVDSPMAQRSLPAGNENVKQRQRIIQIRLRNSILAIELKRAYQYKCQVCRDAVALRPPHYYAEGHHLRPLGGGHNGPDVPGNILVLCPNHHTMFDAGAAAVEPESLRLLHRRIGEFGPGKTLFVEAWHTLDPVHISYHYETIYNRTAS